MTSNGGLFPLPFDVIAIDSVIKLVIVKYAIHKMTCLADWDAVNGRKRSRPLFAREPLLNPLWSSIIGGNCCNSVTVKAVNQVIDVPASEHNIKCGFRQMFWLVCQV